MHIKARGGRRVHDGARPASPFIHIMASYYGLFVTIHLLCAITFIGAVFFEVLVIEPIEKRLPLGVGEQIAEAIPRRVRTFMPVVVALLYLTGGAMFWVHFSSRPDFFQSRFGLLLALKMSLTFAVLGVFVISMRAAIKGTMDVCRFRHTHRIVAVLMLGIVLLAKGMFYL
ncbi:MAG: CopD family copper resistance protein [Rariglobus sp.]